MTISHCRVTSLTLCYRARYFAEKSKALNRDAIMQIKENIKIVAK
jgi:hypothetical protein